MSATIDHGEPEWIVNDLGELGVKLRGRFFFLYKGDSIEYHDGVHDDGTPILWRPVGKREFGETCWPVVWQLAGSREARYTQELIYTPGLSFGAPGDCDWRPLGKAVPAAPDPVEPPAHIAAPNIKDMSLLIARLAYSLKKAAPEHELPAKATAYLKKHDLIGSPLRGAEEPSTVPVNASLRAWVERRYLGDEMVHETVTLQPMPEHERTHLEQFYRLEIIELAPVAPLATLSYMGESGEYQEIGVANGAGTMRGNLVHVYRDAKTGILYYRTPMEFAARMVRTSPAPDATQMRCTCPSHAAPTLPKVKGHVLAAVVNNLRDIAIQFHAAGQLRERLRAALGPLLSGTEPDPRDLHEGKTT
jgi:hypothetical protein